MKARIEYIRDVVGQNYIAVNIYKDIVVPYLNQLEEILDDEFEIYTKNQQNRDHGHYHITVINAMDYNRLSKELGPDKFINSLEKYFQIEFDITPMGLGKATRDPNTAYFIVVKSEELQEFRKVFGLSPIDFHITLGFKWKDVFGVPKNEILKLYDPFLKLLKKEYYKNNETFKFVKQVENFESEIGSIDDEIEVIEIEDTHANFRIGKQYFSIALIDKKLWITAKWVDEKNIPILPNTLIYRKMK